MTGTKVVLDACVLYPAPLRDTLLEAAALGLYRPFWSDSTLTEVTRNLVADGRMTGPGAKRFNTAIQAAFPQATISVTSKMVDGMPAHPNDRHVVAAAVQARAGLLVTFNLRHFPADELEKLSVVVLHPDRFLGVLFHREPFGIANAVVRQQAKLSRPPMTMDEVLASLSPMVPAFVSMLRPMVT